VTSLAGYESVDSAKGRMFFPVPVEGNTPEGAALKYEQLLRSHLPEIGLSFDLTILGLGEDGHTASLFPGTPAVFEKKRWVKDTVAPVAPFKRISMTLPIINRSAHIYFLVAATISHHEIAALIFKI